MLDNFRSIDIVWESATQNIYESIEVVSGDEMGRKLTVQILEDGAPAKSDRFELELRWKTPSGKNGGIDGFDLVDRENSIFEMYFTTGLLSNIGELSANLALRDDLGLTLSNSFSITVLRGVGSELAESTNSFSKLTKVLDKANKSLVEEELRIEAENKRRERENLRNDLYEIVKQEQSSGEWKGEKGDPGEKGEPGAITNLTKDDVVKAIGFTPADSALINDEIVLEINLVRSDIDRLRKDTRSNISRLESLITKSSSEVIKYHFEGYKKGSAEGTVLVDISTLESGEYSLNWMNDLGKLEKYESIKKIEKTPEVVSESHVFIKNNFIPSEATALGLYRGDILVESTEIEAGRKLSESKMFSFGQLADTHVDGDGNDESHSIKDFKSALNFYNEEGVDFISIAGDVTRDGRLDDMKKYKELVDLHSNNLPIYTAKGNHDVINQATDSELYSQYVESRGDYYEVEINGEIFIYLGLKDNVFNTSGLSRESLDWLEERLNLHRNRRVFLIQHVFLGPVGNIGNIYPWSSYADSSSTQVIRFIKMMSHYRNVIFISGHSHLEFDLQRLGENANFSERTGDMTHRVHVPSGSSPRGNKESNEDIPANTYKIHEASQGYVIDVYPSYIVLKGVDFIKMKYLPQAQYIMDTSIEHTEEYREPAISNGFSEWTQGSINSNTGEISESQVSFVTGLVPLIDGNNSNVLTVGKGVRWARVAYFNSDRVFLGVSNHFSDKESLANEKIVLDKYGSEAKYFRVKFSNTGNVESVIIKAIQNTTLSQMVANEMSPWSEGEIDLETGEIISSETHLISEKIMFAEELDSRVYIPKGVRDLRIALYSGSGEFLGATDKSGEFSTIAGEVVIKRRDGLAVYYKISFSSEDLLISSAKSLLSNIKEESISITDMTYWENGSLLSTYPWIEDHNERIRSGLIEMRTDTPNSIVVPGYMYWLRIFAYNENEEVIEVINDYNTIKPTVEGQIIDLSSYITDETRYIRMRFSSATGSQESAKRLANKIKIKNL